jgi:hypothetical protein
MLLANVKQTFKTVQIPLPVANRLRRQCVGSSACRLLLGTVFSQSTIYITHYILFYIYVKICVGEITGIVGYCCLPAPQTTMSSTSAVSNAGPFTCSSVDDCKLEGNVVGICVAPEQCACSFPSVPHDDLGCVSILDSKGTKNVELCGAGVCTQSELCAVFDSISKCVPDSRPATPAPPSNNQRPGEPSGGDGLSPAVIVVIICISLLCIVCVVGILVVVFCPVYVPGKR